MAEVNPPQHVTAQALGESSEEQKFSWPALGIQEEADDWEIVPDAPSSPVVTFDPAAIEHKEDPPRNNPKILKHAQSSPDLRNLAMAGDDSDEDFTEVVKEESSLASSAVMVSGPASVWSVGSNKLSFRDAILQNQAKPQSTSSSEAPSGVPKKPKKVQKTRFIVVKPDSQTTLGLRRNSRSMGNLRALDHIQEDHDEDILGESDAGDYYSRKAQGALGRRNGQKTRPDEAKRLEITMAKKSLQRQRQMSRR